MAAGTRLSPYPIFCYTRMKWAKLTILLNPPPDSSAATSGMEVVPPTAVTHWAVPKSVKCEQNRNIWTYYGQVAGKFGMN